MSSRSGARSGVLDRALLTSSAGAAVFLGALALLVEEAPVVEDGASAEDEAFPFFAGDGPRPTSSGVSPEATSTSPPPLTRSARAFCAFLMPLVSLLEGLTTADLSLSNGSRAAAMPCATAVWLLEQGGISTTVMVEKEEGGAVLG